VISHCGFPPFYATFLPNGPERLSSCLGSFFPLYAFIGTLLFSPSLFELFIVSASVSFRSISLHQMSGLDFFDRLQVFKGVTFLTPGSRLTSLLCMLYSPYPYPPFPFFPSHPCPALLPQPLKSVPSMSRPGATFHFPKTVLTLLSPRGAFKLNFRLPSFCIPPAFSNKDDVCFSFLFRAPANRPTIPKTHSVRWSLCVLLPFPVTPIDLLTLVCLGSLIPSSPLSVFSKFETNTFFKFMVVCPFHPRLFSDGLSSSSFLPLSSPGPSP